MLLQAVEQTGRVAAIVVDRSDSIDADRELRAPGREVFAGLPGGQRNPVGRNTHLEVESFRERSGELAQGRPEERLASQPAHQGRAAGCGAVVAQQLSKPEHLLHVRGVTWTVQVATIATEVAAEVAQLGHTPHDHQIRWRPSWN